MHDPSRRIEAGRLRADGLSLSEVGRRLGAARSTLRSWEQDLPVGQTRDCPRCHERTLDRAAYAATLGYYLGDGCLSEHPRFHALRISCDRAWPGIIDDVEALLVRVRPGSRTYRVRAPGCIVVTSNWKHWPCLFPQHGPGRKHLRRITLEPWQRAVVEEHPADFLRGLFHSDGARVRNWARRTVAGQSKRYEYPRWQFANASDDIQGLCCWALDLVGVAWRKSSRMHISVSRREAVARLDALIGPKA